MFKVPELIDSGIIVTSVVLTEGERPSVGILPNTTHILNLPINTVPLSKRRWFKKMTTKTSSELGMGEVNEYRICKFFLPTFVREVRSLKKCVGTLER